MNKPFLISIAFLSLACTSLAQTDGQQASNLRESYAETTVHDPSVVYDNAGTYYIFGSHLAVSKTTDLINWTSGVGGGETNACTLFANPSGHQVTYADAYNSNAVTRVKDYQGNEVTFGTYNIHDWQYTGDNIQGNQWAPDVIWNPTMRKWLMYMSVNGSNWCSAIVCLAADQIEGPYIYQGPVVFSGFQGTYIHNGYSASDDWKHTDLAIATGATSLPERYNVSTHWGTYWPNCIDPCVKYDNGKLYLTYGSWSGGIFQIQLDQNTGLRDYTAIYPYEINGEVTTPGAANANCTSDPYFGKKIAGGYYVSGEGPYIEKIGEYYYLFLSYGGLTSTGGYEMRVFRSKSIDGPYDNAIYSSYVKNFGTSGDKRGARILGAMGAWGANNEGELAQGHNSVLVDENGDAFLVYHSRFVDGGEGHQVRVRQLFVNENGYLVASPFRYTGKQTTQKDIESKRLFDETEIAGSYQLIVHPYRLDYEKKQVSEAITVTLTSDGKITGGKTGTWSFTDNSKSYIKLTIGGLNYFGVMIRQNVDKMVNTPAVAISAVCGTNNYQQAMWLYKVENSSDKLTTAYPTSVIKNTNSGWWQNFSQNQYAIELGDQLNFHFYNYSDKANNWHNWCLYGANVAPNDGGYKEYFGIRNDNYNNTAANNTGCTSDFNWDTFKEDMDGSLVDMTVTYSKDGLFTMKSVINTVTGKKYNYSFEKTIDGAPSNILLFFVNEGSYIDGLTLGINSISCDDTLVQNGKTYNMQGQLVDDNYQGIVIQNGKKRISK